MSKRKVDQDQLRKLMAKAAGAMATSANKRYKVSARELALIEEQKREEEKEKTKARLLKEQKKAAMAPVPSPDVRPAKSILKKTNYQPQFQVLSKPKPVSEATGKPPEATPASSLPGRSEEKEKPGKSEEEGNSESALPEGFFDDPVADAKARKVAYVDHEEEEWEKFQKEIDEQMNAAQSILVEDRMEATVDRQIEEIDEQIEAWSRVAKLEKQKDVVENLKKEVNIKNVKEEEDSDEDDDDVEEFLDWRNKC